MRKSNSQEMTSFFLRNHSEGTQQDHSLFSQSRAFPAAPFAAQLLVTKIPLLRTNVSRKKLMLLLPAGFQLPPLPSKLVTGNLRGIKMEARIRFTPE